MANLDVTPILDLCIQCIQRFPTNCRLALTKDNDDDSSFPEGLSPVRLDEVYARFCIWNENIGALKQGKASLDYRIRNTDVCNEVIRLLRQLLLTLGDCMLLLLVFFYMATLD